jgi:hypothetical protein
MVLIGTLLEIQYVKDHTGVDLYSTEYVHALNARTRTPVITSIIHHLYNPNGSVYEDLAGWSNP